MPEELEVITKTVVYFLLFLLPVLILTVAIATASPKAESYMEERAKKAMRAWHSEGKARLRKHLPAFLAAYAIMAGLAIVLGRFDIIAALVGCPAVAAGMSYFFNRFRRAQW